MRRALVSLMCHPDRKPRIEVNEGAGYEVFVNRTPNYADAYRFAIGKALESGADLVTADSDGYHPSTEVVKLAQGDFYRDEPALVLPYRENMGVQSSSFSLLFSLVKRRRVRDATGGLCRLSHELMVGLPQLKAKDMTVHIEILAYSLRTHAKLVQYGYLAGDNDEAESKRTAHYQLKLLGAMLR